MPLRLDVKRKLSARSDRVKGVDLHPSEPWMLVSLYNGNLHVWNYESQTLVKSFEVCDLPVRAARFVARKNWVISGSDDMAIRVFNYNTLERVHSFEAHSDYIRSIAVHPTQPFILTSSDDMLIKLWDWDNKWHCSQVFEGHTHYVMQIVFNPKDNNTFASASLDRTVKVWQLGSGTPNFTLDGHEKGVNCVDYYSGGDRPYLVSGADDRLVKIWDYQNKTCVQTLEGHAQNISCVGYHPELPIIMTGSEDGTVRIWHANTYRLETTLNYGLERVWAIASQKGSNNVAFGYDEGSILIKLGREEPAMSMDTGGKIMWAKHSEIQQANLKSITDMEVKDGERLPLGVKDMGSCEIFPQTISHNPNGRFVVVCGDGEYIIYTAMALRNKSYGSALEFVWSHDSSEYATRESTTSVKLFKNFKERKNFKPDFGAEGIYGGYLLGIKSSSGLAFYDWENTELIRRIEIIPKNVFWADTGELVCIATDESFFILKYNAEAVSKAQEDNEGITEDGIEDAFEVVGEIEEIVKTGLWVGDCFIYTNSVNRLNYYVGGEIVTISHLDRVMYILGYIAKDDRLYLGDKELNVISYSLLLSVLEYQTAVMRRDFETADKVLPTVPKDQRTRVAHFLEKQGFKSQALAVSCDPEHKFELAIQLGELKTAYQLAQENESETKWKQLADMATNKCEFRMAQECLHKAQDFGGLLLLASCSGDSEMVSKLADNAAESDDYTAWYPGEPDGGSAQPYVQIRGAPGSAPGTWHTMGELAGPYICKGIPTSSPTPAPTGEYTGCKTTYSDGDPFTLYPGDMLYSYDMDVRLIMQEDDGNLCLYTADGATGNWTYRWCSFALGIGNFAVLDNFAGNLIVYDVNDAPIWNATGEPWPASILPPYPPITLCVDDCGKAFLYGFYSGERLWESNYTNPPSLGYPVDDCIDAAAPTPQPTTAEPTPAFIVTYSGCVTIESEDNPLILYPGEAVYSNDLDVRFIMQETDGNLCLYTLENVHI